MNLYHDSATIPADPVSIWRVVSDPTQTPIWNAHVHEVRPVSKGPPQVGYRYEIIYDLQGVRTQLEGELTIFEEPRHLVCRCRGGTLGPSRMLREEVVLTRVVGGTRVSRSVDLLGTKVPWVVRKIVKAMARWGHPESTVSPALERLEQVVVAARE